MTLADFYRRIGPFLLGQVPHEEAVSSLYGSTSPQPDAERLAIYGRFCRNHRHEVLDGIYVALHAMVVERYGEAVWAELVDAYFRANPMHHFELNHNAAAFPSFLMDLQAQHLAGESLELRLPEFVVELADFEWWEWQTLSAIDAAADLPLDEGPLRLHSTVELRPYHYDLLAWFDHDDEQEGPRPVGPALADQMVLFWRDRKLSLRRDLVSPLELQLIKAVYEGMPIDAKLAQLIGTDLSTLAAVAWDLYRAGILLGAPGLLPVEDEDGEAD